MMGVEVSRLHAPYHIHPLALVKWIQMASLDYVEQGYFEQFQILT
jgi:hypothetical protein